MATSRYPDWKVARAKALMSIATMKSVAGLMEIPLSVLRDWKRSTCRGAVPLDRNFLERVRSLANEP